MPVIYIYHLMVSDCLFKGGTEEKERENRVKINNGLIMNENNI